MAANEIPDVNNITEDIAWPLNNTTNNSKRWYNFSALENDTSLKLREIIIIIFYSTIVVVSIFGNLLVCNIVARKASMRRTTYVFIANLALSDLLMTVLNIPFNVARVLLQNWPFGGFMCSFVPLVQVTSVYVSTFTMMFIALDRYRVICKPLMPRLSPLQASKIIALIWLVAIILSLPHAIYNSVEPIFTYRLLIRCRSKYPANMSRWIMLITFLTQYLLPLTVTGMAYLFIAAQVWSRNVLGVVTEAQIVKQAKAKRKTIKMLVCVVIFFAVCWLPINLYHLIQEFMPSYFRKFVTYKSTIYFVCHWLAMSSVCYNPFIYCWLNKNFRSGAYACLVCIRNVGRKLNYSFRSTRELRLTDLRCDYESQSYDSRTETLPTDILHSCKSVKSHHSVPKSGTIQRRSHEFESIPMKPIYIAKWSEDSVSMYVKDSKGKYHSVPEMGSGALDSKEATHYPIKKCVSWNE